MAETGLGATSGRHHLESKLLTQTAHPLPSPPAGSAVQAAVEELRPLGRQHDSSSRGAAAVHGIGCNVARPAEVAALADFAKEQLGTVDMWIKCVLCFSFHP